MTHVKEYAGTGNERFFLIQSSCAGADAAFQSCKKRLQKALEAL